MSKEFTDLLDDYLEEKRVIDEAKKNFEGYDFSYFYWREIERYDKAKAALNDAFRKVAEGDGHV